MTTFAIIPARSGSTRLPGKNLLEVGGKLLLVRALESAAACDRVVVTGGEAEVEAAQVWRDTAVFARQPDRQESIDCFGRSTHMVDGPLEPVMLEALTLTGSAQLDDLVVLLQPTSPFRTATHVREAVELAKTSGRSVVSVCRDGRPAFFAVSDQRFTTGDEDTNMRRLHYGRPDTRKLEKRWRYENGAIYVTTVRSLVEHYDRAHDPVWYDMSVVDSVDVDTQEDLDIARAFHAEGLAK